MEEDLKAGNIALRKSIGLQTPQGKLLNSLWENAKREIHNSQVGSTEQGTRHCLAVENNIATLLAEKTKNFNKTSLFVVSASAALHNIAKSRFNKEKTKNHGRSGAKIILNHKFRTLFFSGDGGMAEVVSYIISAHDDGLIDKDIPNHEYPLGSPPGLKLRCLAALFRLADMLDTDYTRASYIQKLMSKKDISDIYTAREAIRGWKFNKDDQREILIQAGKIGTSKTRSILKKYIDALNKSITESQKRHLSNFENIYFKRKECREILSFPYTFRLIE